MNNISLQNSYLNQQNLVLEENKKKQEAFTALDKEQLKQDTAQFATKAQENAKKEVKQNWLTRNLNKLKNDDTKKSIIATLGAIASVVVIATVGNKLSNKIAKGGVNIDKFLLDSDNIIAKGYRAIGKKFASFKTKAATSVQNNKFLKETIGDIKETLTKRKATQKCDMSRGYGNGDRGIFALTPVDILQKKFSSLGDVATQKDTIKKLVGESKTEEIFELLTNKSGTTNIDTCKKLTQAIAQNFKCGDDKGKLLEVLEALKKGETYKGIDFSDFTNVIMVDKEAKGLGKISKIVSDWWPVRIIDKLGEKALGSKWKGFGRGNLGDALIKFNMTNGGMAKTRIGKLFQHSSILVPESFSNFVNDKSGLGVFLGISSIIPFMKDMQDAPKEKKASTATNYVFGNAINWALSMPMAFGATYGLASLKNLEAKNILTKGLKTAGKFFGMGLDKIAKDGTLTKNTNKITGALGGALRFAMIMLVFSPKIGKGLEKITHKVFGKPYDKNEVLKEKQIEEAKNQIIPELGISQGDLIKKLESNPQLVQKIQQNPDAIKLIEENPKALLDLLNGKTVEQIKKEQASTPKTAQIKPGLSQANMDLLNKRKNPSLNPKALAPAAKEDKTTKNLALNRDTATYIPSSEPSPNINNTLSEAQAKAFEIQMSKADKALEKAKKYL